MRKLSKILGVALLLVLPAVALAQGERGALTGVITDPTGAVVPEATITITEMRTGVTTTVASSSAGYYRVPVSPGTYKLEAIKEGFKTAVAEKIVVPIAQVVTIDFTLQIGSKAESVTVTSEAPLLVTSTAEVSNALSPQEFATLPIMIDDGSRQLMTFIYKSLPGAVGGSWNGSINGGQYFSTDILIEGLPVARYDLQGVIGEVTPSADTASEFKVQMSSYSAEYGNTGGGIANFGMKSGANDFHGAIYEYVANPIFNARGWAVNILPEGAVNKVKAPVRENNYGFTFGGPIRKNKTFFFGSFEGDNMRAARPTGYQTAPTVAMRDNADFSAWLGSQVGTDPLGRPAYSYEIYNPTTTRQVTAGQVDPVTGVTAVSTGLVRDAFGFDPVTGLAGPDANIIPSNYWSVASAKMLPEFPDPVNSNLTRNHVVYSGHPVLDWYKYSIKIDHVFNDSHKMTSFFFLGDRERLMGNSRRYWLPLPGYPINQTKIQRIPSRIFRLSEDWTINPSTLNRFAVGYNRFGNDNGVPAGDPEPWLASKLGLQGIPDTGFPQIQFRGRGSLLRDWGTWGWPGFNAGESFVYQDVLTHVRGKHSYKFGAEFIRYRMNDRYLGAEAGSFRFNEAQTGLPGSLRSQTGHPFASFIMGAVNAGSRSVSATTPGYRAGLLSFYAQDDWKVAPKLTFNLGLRWDIPTVRTEVYDRQSSFDPTLPNPSADNFPGALAFLGDCQGCSGRKSFQDGYYREIGPRFGFAYSATSKLVIRGGYGISYSPPIMNGWLGATPGFNSGVPFGSRSVYPTQFGNAADPVLYWSDLTNAAIPAGARTGVPPFTATLPDRSPDGMNDQEVTQYSRSLAQPYVQNWNFGLQYMLPAEVLVEANYVAQKGTRLIATNIGRFGNQPPTQFMALGDYLDWDVDEALADPDASAALAGVGFTEKPYPSFSGLVDQAIKPYPQFSNVRRDFYNIGSSTYHSAQVTVRKRTGHGLNFIAAYTFSKTLSNVDDPLGYYGGYWGGYTTSDFYNPGLEKSIASFDYPHFFKFSWVYDLPFGKGKKWLSQGGVADKLLGGWRLTGIHNYRSGDPLQIYYSWVWSSISQVPRGDVIPGVNQKVTWQGPVDPSAGTPYLNPDAFSMPPLSDSWAHALRPGTAPRLLPYTRGPSFFEEDFGIIKDTNITERVMLRFRADFFNVLNRTGTGNPNTDTAETEASCGPDCANFGKVFGVAHGPRGIMLSLRLEF